MEEVATHVTGDLGVCVWGDGGEEKVSLVISAHMDVGALLRREMLCRQLEGCD